MIQISDINDDDYMSVISSIEPILTSKFRDITEREIHIMQTYWNVLFFNDEDIDAPYKLRNLLAIIDNLEDNTNSPDGKYRKSDFEHIMLYLKGELTPEQLGLIESETFFFSFEGRKFDNLTPFKSNKEKLSTIGYFFSRRNSKLDNIAGEYINFLSNHSRITDNANPIITNTRLSEISSTYPFLSDFIDSHSICQISRLQQSVLLKILDDSSSARVLERNISELKRDKPDSYYSEVLGEAILKCVIHKLDSGDIQQEYIDILTTNIQFISSLTYTECNNIYELWKGNETFRNKLSGLIISDESFKGLMISDESFKKNIFILMRRDEGFKDLVFSGLSTSIKRQYYQFMVENHPGFHQNNHYTQKKIKECFLDIPQELIDLLSLTSADVLNWQNAEIKQQPSFNLLKEIDLEAKDSDRSELKFFATLDMNGNFIMGSMNPENNVLISGLKISRSGKMEVGRFDTEGNLVINAVDQSKLIENYKQALGLNAIEISDENMKLIKRFNLRMETLKRLDLTDAKIGLPIKETSGFISFENIGGKWFLGTKNGNSKIGVVLSGNGIENFNGTDKEIRDNPTSYKAWSEELTPPPAPPRKAALGKTPDDSSITRPVDKISVDKSIYIPTKPQPVEISNPDDDDSSITRPVDKISADKSIYIPTKPQPAVISNPDDEVVSSNCCGLFTRMIKRIRSNVLARLPNPNAQLRQIYKESRKFGQYRF